jgi:HlyD family secretion protein
MMMGQHVYILPGVFEQGPGIRLNASFVDKEGEAAYVWAAGSKDTLERRAVTLGTYDEATDSYEITEGLTVEDYVAPVGPGLAEGQQVVKYNSESYGDEDADSSAAAEGSAFGEEYFEGEGSVFGEENFEDDAPTDEQENMEEAPATLVAAG